MRRVKGRKGRSCYSFLVLIILVGYVLQVGAQEADKRIEAIRLLASQVDEQIAESERVEEGTGIFANELVVNKGDKPWPAVGIYRTVIKFYYTFGDREKNPYPDRLLKITVTTNRSDRHEYAEYLFNPAGQLIFHYQKDGESAESEIRSYFAGERLIRRMTGERIGATSSRESVEAARSALAEKHKLREIFVRSLGD